MNTHNSYLRHARWIRILIIASLAFSFLSSGSNTQASEQPRALLATVNAPADPYWYGFASGNDVRSNLVFDGNYVWVGSGGGVVRWDKTTHDYRMYLPSDGLVTYAADSIVKDRNGALWIGSYAGITKYDGRDWTIYRPSEIGFSSVWRSAVDSNGNLWFGGYHSGLSKFDGTSWTRYNTADTGVQGKNINAIVADTLGNVYALSSASGVTEIHKFDGTTWTHYPASSIPGCSTDVIEMLAVAPDNDLWIACSYAIATLHAGQWTSYTNANGVYFSPNSLAFGPDGTVYAAGGGVYRLNSSGNFEVVATGFDMGGYNNSLAIDLDGKIWAGTQFGVKVIDGGTVIDLLTSHHLSNNNIGQIAIDSKGRFWALGESGNYGANSFDGTTWTTHCPFDGGASQACQGGYGIAGDNAGNIWVSGNSLVRYDGTSWSTFYPPDAEGETYYSISPDSLNGIWTASGTKLYHFDGLSQWDAYPYPDTGYHNFLEMAVQGNSIWMVGIDGAFRWDGSAWTVYSTSNGLPSNTVRGIAVKGNEVWLATEAGAARFDGATWTTYTTANGLPNNSLLDVTFAPDGALWAGTDNWGQLARFDGASWTRTTSNYLVNGDADELLFEPNGNLWIVNRGFGIRVYNPAGLVHGGTIPDGGGAVNSLDGSTSLIITPETFNEPVIVTIQTAPPAARLPGQVGVGETYEIMVVAEDDQQPIDPNPGETFDISIKYNPSSLSPILEQNLALYWWDGSNWVKEPTSQLDLINQVVTGNPDHLSRWAVLSVLPEKVYLPALRR